MLTPLGFFLKWVIVILNEQGKTKIEGSQFFWYVTLIRRSFSCSTASESGSSSVTRSSNLCMVLVLPVNWFFSWSNCLTFSWWVDFNLPSSVSRVLIVFSNFSTCPWTCSNLNSSSLLCLSFWEISSLAPRSSECSLVSSLFFSDSWLTCNKK